MDLSSRSPPHDGQEPRPQSLGNDGATSSNRPTVPQSHGTSTPAQKRADALAGENSGFNVHQDICDFGLMELLQDASHSDYEGVWKFATPRTPALRATAGELATMIAADLEARLSKAAVDKSRRSHPWIKADINDQLDAWAMDILDWTGFSAPATGADSEPGFKLKPTPLAAESIGPCYATFLLFVAHRVKAYAGERAAAGDLKPEDCRLILPMANEDCDDENPDDEYSNDEDSANEDFKIKVRVVANMYDVNELNDLARTACAMLPLSSSVESQPAPEPHLVVANAEIASSQHEFGAAVHRLANDAKALYFTQHNRRFAWGLTICCRTVRAYVYGPDAIWVSGDIDITSAAGRQTLISLLVDWSLSSVDCLGFDPSIRYALDNDAVGPYFEIDVHEKNKRTGKLASRTYYSKRCVVAAASLTGRHSRYFAASTSLETMDNPTVLVKDAWVPLSSDHSGKVPDEGSTLDVLHAAFDDTSEFKDKFPQLVSSGPVYLRRRGRFVQDKTATIFAGLPSGPPQASAASGSDAQGSIDRQHKRTVMHWAGNMISAATNPNHVIIAIVDAMAALNAAYDKCKILHCNISDRAILIRETADGVSGVLMELDYATCANPRAGIANCELPELVMFRPILSLVRPDLPRTILDAFESLLYLICYLGTCGVTQAERAAFDEARLLDLPIKLWSTRDTENMGCAKSLYMDSLSTFANSIARYMHPGLLRDLATDLHTVLFTHIRRSGAYVRDISPLEVIKYDPPIYHNTFVSSTVAMLLSTLAMYRDKARGANVSSAVHREVPPPSTDL
ncbi:hypothetical protein GGF42_001570 [Coemansia sp. RSA 2424]|nr:hypothetical protein GGF42_001570 [Coemansia sp. RSA 2424]